MANQEGSTPPRSGVKTQLVIAGTTVDVEYLGDGHYSTVLGTFTIDELERYVRGRNGTAEEKVSGDVVWPGLYNPS